jgi:hypothetical protein
MVAALRSSIPLHAIHHEDFLEHDLAQKETG